MSNSKCLITPKIFFAIFLFFGFVNMLSAQDADFVATPSTVNVNPNDTFSVVIQVQINSGEIDAAEIHLDFDPSVVQINALTNVGAAQLGIPVLPNDFSDQVDNVNGTIDLAYGNLFGANPTTSFDFIQIDLTAMTQGTTSLAYSTSLESKITSGGFDILGNANDVSIVVGLANEDPVASFFATPTSGTAELLVNVDAAASSDDGNIVSYDWNFGDTNTAVGVSASNNYLNQGNYTITLTVTDDLGATNSTTQNIVVNEVVITNYTITASAGANGIIDPLTATIAAGSNPTFIITPNTGYEIADVVVETTAGTTDVTADLVASNGAFTYDFANVQADATITASFSETPPFQLCIASGSVALTAFGRTFEQDNSSAGATAHPTRTNGKKYDGYAGPIAGTTPGSAEELLFQKEIYGGAGGTNPSFSYDIPVTDGFYKVDLYFAEVFHATTGKRIFDVSLEGNRILDEYEIVDPIKDGISTFQTAITRTYYVNVQDGSLQVGIGSATIDNGKLSGLCITAVGSTNVHPIANIGALNFDALAVVAQPLNITDANNDQFTISFSGMPASLTYDSASNQLEGTPTVSEAGTYTINAIISDGTSSPVTEEFELVINGPVGDEPPTIVAIPDVEISEGGTASVIIQVNDDIATDPTASIIIYDKSEPGGTNNPFAPALAITGYTFTDNGGGNFTLNWPTTSLDGRSYEARVTADDEVNAPVESRFAIDVAQNISEIITARTFSSPLPWYTNAPQSPFTVIIENNTAQNLGYVDPGDFVEYLIEVPFAGTYDVEFFTGKGNAGPLTISISEENGGGFNTLGTVDANQSGWQTYVSRTTQVTFTNSGIQTLRLDFSGAGGVNIRDFNFTPASDFAPVIDAIANVEVDEGETVTVPIIVTDDTIPAAVVSIEIFDKSEPGGTNNPFTPSLAISGYTFTDDGGGNYSLVWNTATIDGRSYEARVTANDGVNTPVIETFTIDVAQDIPGIILARTFANPVPWYGNGPQAPFTISIEAAGNIGYVDSGEFTEYLIDVPAAGTYNLRINASKGIGNSGLLTISEEDGGGFTPLNTVTVIQNGWTSFADYTTQVIFSNSGLQTLRFDFAGGMNTTEFEFTEVPNSEPIVSISAPIDAATVNRGADVNLTGTAIDTEDGDISENLTWTSNDTQFTSIPLDGVGASITGQFVTPGVQTIRATVTDSDTTEVSEEITINVLGPQVDITSPLDTDMLASTDVTLTWTGTDVLFGLLEHYHIFVNPPDINNINTDTRISTASQIGQEFWDLTATDGIQEGINTIVIRTANQSHEEFTNPEAQDLVSFTVCTTDITSITPQNPSDCSLNDGEIVIVATGTNLEYSINNGTTFENSGTFTDLDAGTYDIVVREVGTTLCSATDTVILTSPEVPTISEVVTTDLTDCTSDNGSISITAVGTDLEYSIDGGTTFGSANSFTDLATGAYAIVVREVGTASCTATDSVTLVAPVAPSITEVASTNPTDCSVDNGTISVTATGTNLEYSIDNGGSFVGTNSFADLAAGTYDIVVREVGATTCTASDSVILVAPEAPSISDVASTNPTDCSVNNGTISVTATGTNLEYSIDNGGSFVGTNSFADLTAGTYDIIVREVGTTFCAAIDTVTLIAPEAPSISEVTPTNPTDCSVDNGTILVTATGTNLEYSIDNGGSFVGTNSFADLAAGTYDIIVREVGATTCTAADSVTLVAPEAPSISDVASTNPTDCSVDNGTILVTATGANLEYSIDNGGSFVGTNSFADLAAGTYDIVIREVGTTTCTDADSVTLVAPEAPSITEVASTNPADCSLDNGTISVTATGTNLEYSIDNGATFVTTNSFADLAAGTYDIVIREVGTTTCTDADSVTLVAPEAPSITEVASTDPTDCSLDNGTISVTATGTNLEYSIDSGASFVGTNSFTDLASGTYSIIVREAGPTNCIAVDSITLTAPEAPSITSVTPIDPTTCSGTEGTITIVASGTNLEYSINNGGSFQPTGDFSGLADGTYNIAVREIGTTSCTATSSAVLEDPMDPMPTISGPLTYLEGSGGVTLDAGPEWASYLWSPGGETTQTITATDGTYTVTVVNVLECEGTSMGVIVTEEEDSTPPEAICQSIEVMLDENGNASITAAEIDNGSNDVSGIASLSINIDTFTCGDLGANSVMLTVTDNNGNVNNCTATVTVIDEIEPTITCATNVSMVVSGPQVLQINSATAVDNCDSSIMLTSVRSDNAALGLDDPFPIGQTMIQWTATDASGNMDVCIQSVTLNMAQSMSNEIISFSVPNQIGAEIIDSNSNTVDLTVAIGTDVTALLSTIQISSLASIVPNSGVVQDFSAPVIYMVTAEDGTSQQWTVTVTLQEDTIAPSLISLNPLDNSTDIAEDEILIATFDEPVQLSSGGEITITDLTDATTFGTVVLNGPITFTGNTMSIDPMLLFETGHEYNIEIPNTALEDLAGNPFVGIPLNGWSFTIFEDTSPPVITCPVDIVVDNDPGECGAIVNYDVPTTGGGLTAKAIPTVDGELIRTGGLPTGAIFPIGTTTVTYEVTDENGITASCSFDVTVNDVEFPTVTCTADITETASLGANTHIVTYDIPDFDDNCANSTIYQTAGLPNGGDFPVGTTTNTFEVTDASGNKATCSFDVIIEETLPTVLSVTSFTLINADTNQDLFTIVDGMQIDINSLPTMRLDVRANTTSDVESVRFSLTGELTRSHGESLPPYALFQDLPVGDYMGADFVVGDYMLVGTPFSLNSLRGNQGTPLTVNFSLVEGNPVCVNFDAEISTENDPTMCNGSDGSISISTSNSTAPLSYVWNHDALLNSAVATELSEGSYTVTVTDANGCSETLSVILTDPIAPTVTLSSFADVLDTASAFTLTGGSPAGGSYSGVGVSGGQFNPSIGAGTYAITYSYTDTNTGCDGSAMRNIKVISTSVPTVLSVTSFTLINADTNQDLFTIVEGMQIDINSLPTLHLDIRANTTSDVGSVLLELTGALANVRTESLMPFAFFQDLPVGNYKGADFTLGAYTATATPYSINSLRGTMGLPLSVNFTIAQGNNFARSANNMQISPNPAVENVTASFDSPVELDSFFIYDITGRLIKTVEADRTNNIGNTILEVNGLQAGTYFVRTRDMKGNSYQQQMVIKK